MAKTSYNEALNRLQEILDQMEQEDVDVDQLAKLTKEASKLIKACRTALRNTEKDIDDALNSINEPLE
jgi:exodeoxyribonuclease VII small subunit